MYIHLSMLHQLCRQFFNVAEDAFMYTRLKECGKMQLRPSPDVLWVPELNASRMHPESTQKYADVLANPSNQIQFKNAPLIS